MLVSKLKVLFSHGKQYIPALDRATLPETFAGRIEVLASPSDAERVALMRLCPTGAIEVDDALKVDLGRCLFCRECAFGYPHLLRFTNDYRMAANSRQALCVDAQTEALRLDPTLIRREIRRLFGRSLRLRQVSAGGDGATEMELGASMNVNFDFGRYGIDFVASPRHADGVVITGPITENMAIPLEICYNAIPSPKVVILAGTDAISGGLFVQSGAVNRTFLDRFEVDLFLPGNPVHPLTFIDGVMQLIDRKYVNR